MDVREVMVSNIMESLRFIWRIAPLDTEIEVVPKIEPVVEFAPILSVPVVIVVAPVYVLAPDNEVVPAPI